MLDVATLTIAQGVAEVGERFGNASSERQRRKTSRKVPRDNG